MNMLGSFLLGDCHYKAQNSGWNPHGVACAGHTKSTFKGGPKNLTWCNSTCNWIDWIYNHSYYNIYIYIHTCIIIIIIINNNNN